MYVIDIEKRDSRYSDTQHFKMLCTTEAKKNEFVEKIKAEMLPQVGTFYKETDAGFRYMDESFGMGKILFVDAHEDATAITEFRGEHVYLSNFYETPIVFDGMVYGSVEAAFQAQKCAMPSDRQQFTQLTPSQAKRLGRHVMLRKDWEEVKDNIMYMLVYSKFISNPELLRLLLATGNRTLVEGNHWRDSYWGVPLDTYILAQNHLGNTLSAVRDALRDSGVFVCI